MTSLHKHPVAQLPTGQEEPALVHFFAEVCNALTARDPRWQQHAGTTTECAVKAIARTEAAERAAPKAAAIAEALKLLREEAARLKRLYGTNLWFGFGHEKASHLKHLQVAEALDASVMELAESVGLIGPASRTYDLLAAIQRFHDLICANATIKAAQMVAEAISGAAPQPAPVAQGDAEDAARWRETLMHVGAANHLGGQHFTLNTLRIVDQMFLLRGSVSQHFTKCIDASRAARSQAKEGGAA